MLLFNLLVCASPFIHFHVHHDAGGSAEFCFPSDRHDHRQCNAHSMHACEVETLFEHIYEHGMAIEESSSGRCKQVQWMDIPPCLAVRDFAILQPVIADAPGFHAPSLAGNRIPSHSDPRSPPPSA